MVESPLPDFSDKVVVFYTSNAPKAIGGGLMMQAAVFKQYGDRLFIEGKIPPLKEHYHCWVTKIQGAVAWEDVTSYLIFDSPEQYLGRRNKFRGTVWERIKRVFTG